MDAVKRAEKRETRLDIMAYVRGMQQQAPVRAESVHGFLTHQRRRKLTLTETRDHLAYLSNSGHLSEHKVFENGERIPEYTITAKGMEAMDGDVPFMETLNAEC